MAQQAVADRVERARPGQALRDGLRLAAELVVERLAHDLVGAALHLGGRAARERQHEHARGIHATHGQVRHAMREGVGLARAGAGNDQQWARAKTLPAGKWFAVGHCPLLRSIETSELFGRGRRHRYNNIKEASENRSFSQGEA
jgi:hypothetical protein